MGVLTEEKQIHRKAVHHSIICFTNNELCHAYFSHNMYLNQYKGCCIICLIDELSETFVIGKLVVELLDRSCLCPTLA